VIRAVGLLAVIYLGVAAGMWLLEDRLLFVGATVADPWVPATDLETRDVALKLADGSPIHAWWCPKDGATGAALFCHGSGGNISLETKTYRNLQTEQNVSVLAVEYPGYGKSGGRATEAACYEAAEAGFDWLTANGVSADRVILFGESLGGGVVTELATRRPCRAIVLMMTFTTVRDAAQETYPFLPCRWLMRNHFDNIGKLPGITRPVFIAHGDSDPLISPSHAKKLRDAAGGPTALYIEPGGQHDLVPTPGFNAALREFLAKHAP
jgi:pimeloyl-ACP methyl ester carboxylesterase